MRISTVLTKNRWSWGCILLLALSHVAAVPQIQHWRLENGARIYLVEAHELPMLDLRIVFDAGSARDATMRGLAALTCGLLDQGAGGWDADALAAQLARLGARLTSDSLRDMAIVGLRTLTQKPIMHSALELLSAVVSRPTFPVDAMERGRAQTLTALEDEQQSPESVASKAFYRAIYGHHPYAQPLLGTAESIKSLTREDLVTFHRRYYVGHNAVIVLVGDLDRATAEVVVQQTFGGLPSGVAPTPLPLVAELSQSVPVVTIPFPTTQTHILSGQPSMRRGDPDYFPLYVGNHILGGSGLISRISEEIREKRGLSYSASSELIPMRVAGPFIMNLQTRNDQASAAYQVLRQTLEKFITEGPTQEELVKAQQNITGGFALRLDSNRKVLEYLAMIAFYELPLDYLDRFKANIAAVTIPQIRDSFQRRINPDRLATILVGGKE